MTVDVVTKAGGMDKLGGLSFIDIAPALEAKDIEVKIDGEKIEVLRVNKVREASSPAQALYRLSHPDAAAEGRRNRRLDRLRRHGERSGER